MRKNLLYGFKAPRSARRGGGRSPRGRHITADRRSGEDSRPPELLEEQPHTRFGVPRKARAAPAFLRRAPRLLSAPRLGLRRRRPRPMGGKLRPGRVRTRQDFPRSGGGCARCISEPTPPGPGRAAPRFYPPPRTGTRVEQDRGATRPNCGQAQRALTESQQLTAPRSCSTPDRTGHRPKPLHRPLLARLLPGLADLGNGLYPLAGRGRLLPATSAWTRDESGDG